MGVFRTPRRLERRECRKCGSHTYGSVCGCCYGGDLVPVAVNPVDLGHSDTPRHGLSGLGLSAFRSSDGPRLPGR